MMALLAQHILHEQVTTKRWIGIALITLGVGFVAAGPERTTRSGTQRDSVTALMEGEG